MAEEQQKINLNINDGDSFYAHETSINFSPTQFVLDFKNVSPRIDARSQDAAVITLRHNVVLLDPYHTKQIYELLGQALKKYETDFGTIEQPKAIKEFEKKRKNLAKPQNSKNFGSRKSDFLGKAKGDNTTPTYFG